MKKIGVVSYNIYGNFTNYGSALQSWALNRAIKKLGYQPVLIDYCPEVLKKMNPLNPFGNLWDKDEETKKMCKKSLPAIEINYKKFNTFYNNCFTKSNPYTCLNFDSSLDEVDSYVCGSDTIFCPDEFGIDDGYYANYASMKNNSIAYAASFGDPHFSEEQKKIVSERLKNFKAIGLREESMLDFVSSCTKVETKKVVDPTLLLEECEYKDIIGNNQMKEDYILYYSRRYNPIMERYVEQMSQKKNLKVIEISLRADNDKKGHLMRYDAGVQEFLSLVKNAKFVVTNSFHGMIFAVQFRREFVIFSREQCDTKIDELLDLFGLKDRKMKTGTEEFDKIDYEKVHNRIEKERKDSLSFLKYSLSLL